MIRPGKMILQVLSSIFKKPATTRYPFVKFELPDGVRGEIKFDPKNCIGCKLCMRDCPTGAITIKPAGEKKFEAEIDLGKCIYCGQCVDSCLKKALSVSKNFELAVLDDKKLKVTFDAKSQDAPEKKD